MGVTHTPIRETELGYHLNFRDPDDIALELNAPTPTYADLITQLSTASLPDSMLRDQAERILGPDLVIRPSS
jgi:glyoxylase I family protein